MSKEPERHPSGLRFLRDSGPVADDEVTIGLLKSLLGVPLDAQVISFEFTGKPGVIAPHLHTEDLAAAIIEGRLAFDVGAGLAERLEFGAGDLLLVPANLPHREEIFAPQELRAIVACRREFRDVALPSEDAT
jgi:quercetin dioxygenase-like cupin family protein